jgi:hypothetical protein
MRLSGVLNLSDRVGEEETILPLPCLESRMAYGGLVAIPTALKEY